MGLLFVFNALKIQTSLLTSTSFCPFSYVELTFKRAGISRWSAKGGHDPVHLCRTAAFGRRDGRPNHLVRHPCITALSAVGGDRALISISGEQLLFSPPFSAFSLLIHTESFHIAIPDRGGYFRICLNQILPWKKIRITMCLCSRIGARRNRRLSPAACPSFRGRMRRGTRVRPKQPAGKRDVQTPRRC